MERASEKTGVVLFSSYYRAPTSERQRELDICLERNLRCEHIDRIVLLVDDGSCPAIHDSRIETIALAKRPTYFDWISLSSQLVPGTVSLLANSDIYFDESLSEIARVFSEPHTFMALSRHEESGEVISCHLNPQWSQDVWGFKVPCKFPEDHSRSLGVPLGVPRCDNKVAYIFAIHGWKIVNPCKRIRAVHVHQTGERNYDKKRDRTVLGGVAYVYPSLDIDQRARLDVDVWAIRSTSINQIRLNSSIERWDRESATARRNGDPEKGRSRECDADHRAPTSDGDVMRIMRRAELEERVKAQVDGRVIYEHLCRFRVIAEEGSVMCIDALCPRQAIKVSGRETADMVLETLGPELLAAFVPPVIDPYPICVGDHPRDVDDFTFWQYPCSTEKQAYNNILGMRIGNNIDKPRRVVNTYIGLPWATYIDKKEIPRDAVSVIRTRIRGLSALVARNGFKLCVHTVCQHIHWRRLLETFSELGITDLHVSHCTDVDAWSSEHDIRVHSWPLIAVNVEQEHRRTGLAFGKAREQKRYLASFIGAYAPNYRSRVRLDLAEQARKCAATDIYCELQDEWHFEKVVYREQVGNNPVGLEETERDIARTIRYNEILSDSVFSLCPEGSGPNTLRLWESLAVGSIPVVITDDWLPVDTSAAGIELEDCCIFVRSHEVEGLFQRLRAVPLEKIASMQANGMALYETIRKMTAYNSAGSATEVQTEIGQRSIASEELSPDVNCVCCRGALVSDGAALKCIDCGERFYLQDGVPYIGRYRFDSPNSLIEIFSNLEEKRSPPTTAAYGEWANILREMRRAEDKDEFAHSQPPHIRGHLTHRFQQYDLLLTLLDREDLIGVEVLDIGAGEGFDSAWMTALGARVTAFEFSPISIARGMIATPGVRWICGSADVLPFKSETFDLVVAIATLHHLADIPGSVQEMVRVTRVGGSVVTVSDSYRPSSRGEEYELQVFDRDPAVLRGVNECIPQFRSFVATPKKYKCAINVTMLTSRVFGYPREDGRREDLMERQLWNFPADVHALEQTAGGISLRLEKGSHINIDAAASDRKGMPPEEFWRYDKSSKAEALQYLAQRLPVGEINRPFPGQEKNTKFWLLNGWQAKKDGEDFRRGYQRMRWFLQRTEQGEERLRVRFGRPETASEQTVQKVNILVNGQSRAAVSLLPGEVYKREFDVSTQCVQRPMVVELIVDDVDGSTFDDKVLKVWKIELQKAPQFQVNGLGADEFVPSYVWPNPAFPFRIYFDDPRCRIFLIENIQHNWKWLKGYHGRFKESDVFLVLCGWYHGEAFAKEAAAVFCLLDLKREQFLFLYNSPEEAAHFETFGFKGYVVPQNAWLDENNVMRPLERDKKFNAIYVARPSAFKRHYLARRVQRLALVAGMNHGNPAVELPRHDYLNSGPLTQIEVCEKINEAKCGLILSETEGGCFASSEYLLCGVPVVSTYSKGGRDIWYNDYNAIVCSPDENDVAQAVDYFVRNPRDPEKIRAAHIAQAEQYRERFVSILAGIFQRFGIEDVNPKQYFRSSFFHKMRKSYKPDFEGIFEHSP
jgi:SAM-dependent methyltransferase/glycosyltransferase involved in cell wall biosynthesis